MAENKGKPAGSKAERSDRPMKSGDIKSQDRQSRSGPRETSTQDVGDTRRTNKT